MNIYVTTSNNYHHLLPIFFYLYGKYWGDPCILVGYDKPAMELPDYVTWKSLGIQTTKEDFCVDMKRAFEDEKDPFCWLMEDTFIKGFNRNNFDLCRALSMSSNVGRISLTNNSYKFYTEFISINGQPVVKTPDDSDYRLSLQPAIWRPGYLFKHLRTGFSPWQMENQDGTLMTFREKEFINIALPKYECPLDSNEGVRKRDLFKYDLTGIAEEDIKYLKENGLI